MYISLNGSAYLRYVIFMSPFSPGHFPQRPLLLPPGQFIDGGCQPESSHHRDERVSRRAGCGRLLRCATHCHSGAACQEDCAQSVVTVGGAKGSHSKSGWCNIIIFMLRTFKRDAALHLIQSRIELIAGFHVYR